MKTILRIIVSVMLTYGLLSLTNCSGNDSQEDTAQAKENFEGDRDVIAKDLRDIRSDISTQIERVGGQMGQEASVVSRNELAELDEELLQERERVDTELERVESATPQNWSEVRESARIAFHDVKHDFSQLKGRVSD